jgi:hypothetical protein
LGRTRSSCRPDEYPGRRESQLRERIYVRATRSDQQEGDQPEVRGPTMHPMFVQLYLEADADQDEQDKRRRAARARRLRARAAVRVTAPAANRDRRPRR